MKTLKSLFKGSPFVMAAAGLLVAGIASAAVFNYISNYVKATATVTSPIKLNINKGRDGSVNTNTSITLDATTGGGAFTFTTVAQNGAQNAVSGYNVMVVNETDGASLTGKEIASLMFEDNRPFGPADILPAIYVVEANGNLTSLTDYAAANRSDKKLVLLADSDGPNAGPEADHIQLTTLSAGETRWNVYTITLAGGAVGTYDLYSQYVASGKANLAAYATDQYAH